MRRAVEMAGAGTDAERAEADIAEAFKKGQPRTRTQAFVSALQGQGSASERVFAWVGFAAMLSALVIFGSLVIALGVVALGGVVASGTGAGIAMVVARDVAIITGVAFVAASPFVAVAVRQGLLSPKGANLAELGKGVDKALEGAVNRLVEQSAGLRKSLTPEGKGALTALYKGLESRADNFSVSDKKAYMQQLNAKFSERGIEQAGGYVTKASSLLASMKVERAVGDLNTVVNAITEKMSGGNVCVAREDDRDVEDNDVELAVVKLCYQNGSLEGVLSGKAEDYYDVLDGLKGCKSGREYAVWLNQGSGLQSTRDQEAVGLTNRQVVNDLFGESGLNSNVVVTHADQQQMAQQ